MIRNRGDNRPVNKADRIFKAPLLRRILRLKIFFCHKTVFAVIEKHRSGHKPVNPGEYRLGKRRVLEFEIHFQRVAVDLLLKSGIIKKTLYLGAEQERPADLCVIKRLYPEPVARTEQLSLLPVVNHEGKHSAKHRNRVLSVGHIAFQNDLGIRRGGEGNTPPLKLRAKLFEIVYLSVENDDVPVIL